MLEVNSFSVQPQQTLVLLRIYVNLLSPDWLSLQVKRAVLFLSFLRRGDEEPLAAHRVPSRRPQVVKNANCR